MGLWNIISGLHTVDQENIAKLNQLHTEVGQLWQELFGKIPSLNSVSRNYKIADQRIYVWFERDTNSYSLKIEAPDKGVLPETTLLGEPVKSIRYQIAERAEHTKVLGKSESDQNLELSLQFHKDEFLQEMEIFKDKGFPTMRELFQSKP